MSMKRFLSALVCLCLLLSIAAPGLPSLELEVSAQGQKTSNRESILFELLDDVGLSLATPNAGVVEDLKIEKIDDDEMVDILIIMDGLSVVEQDSKAVLDETTQAQMEALEAVQAQVVAAIEKTVMDGESLDIHYSYTWLLNGIATRVPYWMVSRMEAIDGVKQVLLQPEYAPCQTESGDASLQSLTTGSMISREDTWANGYTGQGITIAVIDTGLDIDHQNFQAMSKDKLTEDSVTKKSISQKLEKLNAFDRYADLEASDVYYSNKVVFGFNYADNNLDITHDNDTMGDHGTHVAGIAAANKASGSDVVGVAPDAQLYIMKVYGSDHGGKAEDILAALEDALLLGADVVNMSLGSSAGFNKDTAEVNAIYNRVSETDTVLCVAAGNSYTSAYGNTWGTNANQTKYPDSAVIGEPALYNNVLSVASVENTYIQRNYIAAGNRKILFIETSEDYGLPTLSTLTEEEYPVVAVPGYGAETDFEGLDLTGKIALIQRGEVSFAVKCTNAEAAGAVACIIYNNTEGEFGMDLTECYVQIPCVSIQLADGEYLLEQMAENGACSVSFPKTPTPTVSSLAYQVSDFSSWGVGPDLSLEPDITAPGGNIYSTLTDGQYGLMSGTSMATPHMAGITALVMQYVRQNYPDLNIPVREFVQHLLVSTAMPLVYMDEDGLYYTPRQQGSGLANALDAISTQAYLTVKGSDVAKAELGDDVEKTGKYSFKFQVNNFGTVPLYYRMDTVAQTEDYVTYDAYQDIYFMSQTPKALNASTSEKSDAMVLTHDVSNDGILDTYDAYLVYQQTQPMDTGVFYKDSFRYDLDRDGSVSQDDVQSYLDALVGLDSKADLDDKVLRVDAGESASVSVTVKLTKSDKAYFETYYPNGGYVEGFTFLTALNDDGVDLSLPYLAFYGSWDDAPILDDGFYWDYVDSDEVVEEEEAEDSEDGEEGEEGEDGEDGEDGEEGTEDDAFNDDIEEDAQENTVIGNQYVNVLWTEFYGNPSYFYPGYNPYITEAFDPSHISISPNDDGYIDTIDDIYISLLRNARYLTFRYVDQDSGEVYYEQTVEYVSKSAYSTGYGQIVPTVYSWYDGLIPMYKFTDNDGETLANNTHLLLQVEALGAYEGATVDSWEVPVTVDLEAPELLSLTKVTQEDGSVLLEMTFRDNLAVSVAALMNSNGQEIYYMDAVEDPEPDADGYRNYTVTYDITDIGGKLMIVLSDYALNETHYGMNTGGAGASYGDLVAYQYNFYAENLGWVAFDEDVNEDEVQITMDEMNFVCAEYVNGYVFAQTETCALYGFRYTDLLQDSFDIETTFITQLERQYADLAYNYVDGELYGLVSSEYEGYPTTELYTINLYGYCYDEQGEVSRTPFEETWDQGRGGLYGLCLAIDAEGTFYIMGTNQNGKTELWHSYESKYGTLFKKLMSLDVALDNAQSMTWDHNSSTLYWSQFNPTSIYTYDSALYVVDPVACTYEQVGALSGETCGMFSPLTPETVASKDIYSNVPVIDASIVGQPVLRKAVVNMNVGGSEKLIFDFDPWYTDHKDVIWSSSDESIVSVDENGNIVGHQKGTAIITVTAADDRSLFDTCVVNVTELTLKIQGIVTSQGAGVGAAYGSHIYEFALNKGVESFTDSHMITAPDELNFGLDIATAVYARGYIWACEYGNTGMIYKIDPATGEVVDSLMPIDGDMLFGLTYNEKLDTFTGIMNMYLFVDLELTHEEQDKIMGSYDEEANQFTYHRINMLEYLIAAGGNYVTGEYGQGASSEVVMCGITTITDSYRYRDTGLDYLGQPAMDMVSYNATQTLVILDNVGRLWYIDQISGLSRSNADGMVTYTSAADPDTNISYAMGGKRDGLIEMQNEDGTYTIFYIRSIEETPLNDMFLDGTMPRITYHFSDIEFGGYTSEGAPIFALSLYDYWNNGTTNELYMYIGQATRYDEEQNAEVVVAKDKLYYLGTTGQYNIVASIYQFELIDGLED